MAEVYEKLRERLDMFPQGFPKTQSGVELEILENLFTAEEAKIALSLKPYPEPVAVVAERMNREESELGLTLYDMSKKGLILRYKESEEVIYYFLAPWVVGIWEFQLKRLNKENIPLYEKYHQEGIVASAKGRSVGGFRVIPVEQEIQDDREIQPFEQVSEIITKHDQPGFIAQSNYYAAVDVDTCEGYEACTERCQVAAIEMKDEVASITYDRCIGCGLCASTCPTGSISMIHKQPGSLSHIFADDNYLIQARAKDTGKTFPFE